MKYRWDKKYMYWGVTSFLVISASALFILAMTHLDAIGGLFVTLINAASSIIYGIVFAYLLTPITNFFERDIFKKAAQSRFFNRKGNGKKNIRKLSVACATIIGFASVITLLLLILPQFVESIVVLVKNISEYSESLRNLAVETFGGEEDNIVLAVIDGTSNGLTNWVNNDLIPSLQSNIAAISNGVLTAIGVIVDIFVGLVVCIYLQYNKEKLVAQCKRIVYSILPLKLSNNLVDACAFTHKKMGKYLTGVILDSIIVGIVTFIFMILFRMPYPMLIAVFIGVTNIIPVFGPFIGAIPCALVIFMSNPIQSLIFIVFIIIMQQIDGNIVMPKIAGTAMGISGFWVIFSVTVGGGLFGFWGMVLSVPIFAALYTGLSMLNKYLLIKKDLPIDTEVYNCSGAVIKENADQESD